MTAIASEEKMHTIRVAVITDLHYTTDSSAMPGSFRTQAAQGSASDPMVELEKFLKKNDIQANWLLCPGDITNQAAHDAFLVAWSGLKSLRDTLHASQLIAVTGNHEVDSRPSAADKSIGLVEQTVDPVGQLQELPDYPATFDGFPDKKWIYWGRGYEVVEDDDTLIVLVNSCHFHITMQPNEYERGKISDVLLKGFRETVNQLAADKKHRILLIHHHPIQHPDTSSGGGQIDMYNGSRLIDVLAESFCDWLVIHGHKHHPRLIRAQGSASPPFVFSAGSFGAALTGTLATQTKNQFYIINLESHPTPLGSAMRGRIEAYYWSGTEWRIATERDHGLPSNCGFSHNIDVGTLAVQIKAHLTSNPLPGFATWAELCNAIPDLNYLMPDELKKLRYALGRMNVKVGGDERLWFPKELSL